MLFSGKGRQSLHTNVMKIRKVLIYCIKGNWIMHCIRLTTVYYKKIMGIVHDNEFHAVPAASTSCIYSFVIIILLIILIQVAS